LDTPSYYDDVYEAALHGDKTSASRYGRRSGPALHIGQRGVWISTETRDGMSKNKSHSLLPSDLQPVISHTVTPVKCAG